MACLGSSAVWPGGPCWHPAGAQVTCLPGAPRTKPHLLEPLSPSCPLSLCPCDTHRPTAWPLYWGLDTPVLQVEHGVLSSVGTFFCSR